MVSKSIKLSVVVPTFNRGDKIENVLNSLKNQYFKDFEVLVVNDGSTDNTEIILNELLQKDWPFPLRVIHQENKGRSGVRNSGFSLAQAEIIVSIDDDMRLDAHCLEEHYKHHLLYPGSILAGEQKEDIRIAKTDIQKYVAYARVDWNKSLQNVSYPMKPEEIYITAANFSISKTTFNKIGGFDEKLRAVVDYDLAMRATLLNIPIYYNSNASGWHDDFITCRWYVLRRRQGTLNENKLQELKPELVAQFHRYKDENISAFKKWLYGLLAHKILVTIIDHYNFLPYVLPAKIRFKLYPAIVTALGKYYPDKKI
ncbi:glycosyltransferase family 2 protein [Rufibacter roseolus]|uniref:glycosyltransferase family 2 protein n=1 Tax=Rufibacter roseolus TaxID=2817375 RepID=UPI001B301410|nr:glycosyltransferase family A protein [Rufibacter roseolus]